MAYNRKNILKRIIEIQETTLSNTKRGCTQKWVYDNLILPRYCISESTYYNYLSTNAKKEINDMERQRLKQNETNPGEQKEKKA
jgi:hypothetical protein